jgi:hypothetical protein
VLPGTEKVSAAEFIRYRAIQRQCRPYVNPNVKQQKNDAGERNR